MVSLPAWGERYVRVCAEETLPALLAALRELRRPARVRLYTGDQALVERTSELLSGLAVVELCRVLGADQSFGSLSRCHQDSMDHALYGERVLLLTADMVVSREVLVTCEAYIADGTQAVCCAPPRALEGTGVPVGASGRDLLAWAWAHRHPMTRECTWPEGRSYDVWRMYFERDGEVAARVFLPHPLVVVPAGLAIHFHPTIDVNLLACFSTSVIRMLTQPEEGAVVELSPPEKDFLLTTTMRERMASGGPSCPPFTLVTNQRHRMFFGKRVVLCGSGGDCGDGEVLGRMLG